MSFGSNTRCMEYILGELGVLCGDEHSRETAAHKGILVRRLVANLLQQQTLGLDREMVWAYLETFPIRYIEEAKNSFLLVVLPSNSDLVHMENKKPLLLDFEIVFDPLVSMGLAKAWGWRLNSCVAKFIFYEKTKGITSSAESDPTLPPTILKLYIPFSAVVATLGGGHFLCRQLNKALALAQFSAEMAEFAGDEALRVKCRMNEAYSLIWAGWYKAAKCIIGMWTRLRTLQLVWYSFELISSCCCAVLLCRE